jgi:hypothetical protein
VCTDLFECGDFVQQETCTCERGRFTCSDETGQTLDGSPPQCASYTGPDDSSCPASMSGAEGSACAVLGRSCFYDGTRCDDGIERLNYCACSPDGNDALAYQCFVVPCPPE